MHYSTDGRLILLTIALLLFLPEPARTQQGNRYFFRHLTQEDGLLHNEVADIVQDKKGFVWIATSNGLQRYDGTRFLNFNDLLNDPSATHAGVIIISEDEQKNMLWVNKANATEQVDLSTGIIRPFNQEDLLNPSAGVYRSYRKNDHRSWQITAQSIFIYDSTSKTSGFYAGNHRSVNRAGGNFVTYTATGETWLGSDAKELRLLDKKTMRVYSSTDDSLYHPLLKALRAAAGQQPFGARYVMLDSGNRLWMASWYNWFIKYDYATQKLTRFQLPVPLASVSCFYEDSHHAIWIGTDDAGLFRYNEAADKFVAVTADDNKKENNLPAYSIRCIFQDREENIWLGTDKGIVLFNPYRQYFRYIHHEEANDASLPQDEVSCTIQARNGDILVATWGGGITVFDSTWNFKRTIHFNNGPPECNLVWSFIQNEDGTIWAGCQHGYIHIYNPVSGSINTIHPPEANNFTIRCMAKDPAGNIWMGLHSGRIIKWSAADKKFYGYNEDPRQRMSSYPTVTSIFFDSKQVCWVSTDRGLRQFDVANRLYAMEYLPNKNLQYQISANTPKGMEELNDTTLLVATLYGGLNYFNSTTGHFTSVPMRDSFLYKNIYAIKKDAAGYCWFTTDYGLCRFKPGNPGVTRFNIGKGIINATFESPSFVTLQNGDWVTNTEAGVVVFNPRKLQQRDAEKLEITGLKVFDSLVPPGAIANAGKPIRLDYNKNFITIEFARLRFNDLQQHNYFYRIKGINDGWINGGTRASASYTNLPPGNYVFEVKADDATDNATTASLHFIIEPPFWKTWWFIGLMIAGVLYAGYLLIQWRFDSVRTKEKLSVAKLEALRSQMNPHFIFNCLSSIDNLIQTGEKSKATTYLAKFARLIRSILETSKSNTVPCWQDMETLALYLEMEALGCDMQFTYQLHIGEEISRGDYRVRPLVIQPFVENAIHHGLLNKRDPDKQLQISVTASAEYIRYIIEDNGIGREKAMEYQRMNKSTHQSMGLQITADRISLHNQNGKTDTVVTDLYDASGQACGTKVEVTLINQP